jgi:hypothetical protein
MGRAGTDGEASNKLKGASVENPWARFLEGLKHMGRQREQTACRLRRLQEAIEGADRGATARMARRVGVSIQRWNNVTRGLPLGMDLTRRLVTRFPGLTTDWLWFGRTDGMSVEMAKALGLVVDSEKEEVSSAGF